MMEEIDEDLLAAENDTKNTALEKRLAAAYRALESLRQSQVALEHENFLTVHRDNMALVLRVAALNASLASMTRERDVLATRLKIMTDGFDAACASDEELRASLAGLRKRMGDALAAYDLASPPSHGDEK